MTEDYFEKELMFKKSKGLIREQKKTVSIFPVGEITETSTTQTDEHSKLMTMMKNRPVDYGDKILLDILDHNMERVSIIINGVRITRASDITAHDIELMGLTINEGELPFDVYRSYMKDGGIDFIEPDTYLYSVVFEYEHPIKLD